LDILIPQGLRLKQRKNPIMQIMGFWDKAILGIVGGALRRISSYVKSNQGEALSLLIFSIVVGLLIFGIIELQSVTCPHCLAPSWITGK